VWLRRCRGRCIIYSVYSVCSYRGEKRLFPGHEFSPEGVRRPGPRVSYTYMPPQRHAQLRFYLPLWFYRPIISLCLFSLPKKILPENNNHNNTSHRHAFIAHTHSPTHAWINIIQYIIL